MKQHAAKIISIHASDTSGVCSALYELGGMTVVHDASGCNSTYSTFDEPRWYGSDSMIYISALTEADVVMGNDEKLVSDIVSAAKDLAPAFIAVCGSPLPAMVGTDFDAVAREIQSRSGIPAFGLNTNGIRSYLAGASEAFVKIAGLFCQPEKSVDCEKKFSVNIIGATPLDFSVNGSVESIKLLLERNGFEVVSCIAMNSSLSDVAKAGRAHVNLVVSYSGLACAKLLEKRFGTPFAAGVPFGGKFSLELMKILRETARSRKSVYPCVSERRQPEPGRGISIIGESVAAGSLACASEHETGVRARVLCPLETEPGLLADCDGTPSDEDAVSECFANAGCVVGDPLYAPVCPESVKFIPLPHEAFSGRCFRKDIPDLIGCKLTQWRNFPC